MLDIVIMSFGFVCLCFLIALAAKACLSRIKTFWVPENARIAIFKRTGEFDRIAGPGQINTWATVPLTWGALTGFYGDEIRNLHGQAFSEPNPNKEHLIPIDLQGLDLRASDIMLNDANNPLAIIATLWWQIAPSEKAKEEAKSEARQKVEQGADPKTTEEQLQKAVDEATEKAEKDAYEEAVKRAVLNSGHDIEEYLRSAVENVIRDFVQSVNQLEYGQTNVEREVVRHLSERLDDVGCIIRHLDIRDVEAENLGAKARLRFIKAAMEDRSNIDLATERERARIHREHNKANIQIERERAISNIQTDLYRDLLADLRKNGQIDGDTLRELEKIRAKARLDASSGPIVIPKNRRGR